MPKEKLLINVRKKEKKCCYTVGTVECLNCVKGGNCPSCITTIEEIAKIESGRGYCVGRQ